MESGAAAQAAGEEAVTAAGNVVAFPQHRTRTRPETMAPGDWFITRGPGAGPASWMTWVAQDKPTDCGGSVGAAVRAMPLVAPDGTWPYGDAVSREVQWVQLSRVETLLAMPGESNALGR